MRQVQHPAARRLAALVALLAVLSGCAPAASTATRSSTAAPIATPPVPGIVAIAVRLRTDRAVGGQFQTRITNTGTEQFSVLGVRLDSPGFQPLPYEGRPATYRPGAVIDLPTRYGTVVCDDGVEVDPVFAALQVQRPDGRMEELRVPLEAPDDIVHRIHREECHAIELAAAIGVSLGGEFSTDRVDGQTVLRATITLTRGTSTEAIALVGLRGSVIFDVLFADDSEPPPTMPPDEDELVVPVLLRKTAWSCLGHVIGETKQPFLFPFYLTFDGGEAQYGVLAVSPQQRDALWAYNQAVCGTG